ncbi:hypothetical protein FRB93_012674 [Tulasnella sp. JGI-2019a]|nr:hypothetical protein FRB93_012674 [Tulasnella sp. JGI-2019a]
MAQSAVTVLLNDTRVVYWLGGQQTTLAGITNGGGPAAFLGQCGSFVGLYATNSAASLLFTGTSVTVNVLADEARGGPYDVYLDGTLNQQGNNYAADGSNPFSNSCNPLPVSIANLPNTVHNVTVVNFNGGLQELLVQSFTYIGSPAAPTGMVSTSSSSVPSSTSTPTTSTPTSTTTSATPSATQAAALTTKHSSVGPIVGGVIGAIVIIALLIALFFFCRRQNRSKNIDLAQGERTPPTVLGGDNSKYTNVPHQMAVVPSALSATGDVTDHNLSPIGYASDTSTQYAYDPYSNVASIASSPANPQSVTADSKSSRSAAPLPLGAMRPTSGPFDYQQPSPRSEQTQRESTAPSTSQSQVEIIQAMLARGIPNEEISAMIRMMAATGGSSSGGSQGGGNAPNQTLQLVAGTPPSYDFKG